MGFAAMPEVNIRATMPTMAATMTTGISLVMRLPGTTRGISGGACSATSPPGVRGTGRRAPLSNRTVLTLRKPPPLSVSPITADTLVPRRAVCYPRKASPSTITRPACSGAGRRNT